jgi:hypothetical protein
MKILPLFDILCWLLEQDFCDIRMYLYHLSVFYNRPEVLHYVLRNASCYVTALQDYILV